MKQNGYLSQKKLTTKLRRLGFHEITERRIIDWRRKGLLPNFDLRGRGYGKGKGRADSCWVNGDLITNRAIWVCRLLKTYRSADAILLPLWMLGFDVPALIVREKLIGQLEGLKGMFETEATEGLESVEPYERKDGIIEDYIGDLAFNWAKRDRIAELTGMPQEVMEVPMNLLFNPDYNTEDLGIEEGRASLEAWKKHLESYVLPVLSEGLQEASLDHPQAIHPEGIEMFFERPLFFQDYLSVASLLKSVRDATDSEIDAVQQDMMALGGIVERFGAMLTRLMKHASNVALPSREEILDPLFKVSSLVVLADLSARKNGLSEAIDNARSTIVSKVQDDISSIGEAEFEKAGSDLSKAFENGLQILNKNLEKLSARAAS